MAMGDELPDREKPTVHPFYAATGHEQRYQAIIGGQRRQRPHQRERTQRTMESVQFGV